MYKPHGAFWVSPVQHEQIKFLAGAQELFGFRIGKQHVASLQLPQIKHFSLKNLNFFGTSYPNLIISNSGTGSSPLIRAPTRSQLVKLFMQTTQLVGVTSSRPSRQKSLGNALRKVTLCPRGIKPRASSKNGILCDLVPPIVIIRMLAQVQQCITVNSSAHFRYMITRTCGRRKTTFTLL